MGSQIPCEPRPKRVLKEVISIVTKEEVKSDGQMVQRTIISQKPVVYRIWIKNSTAEDFHVKASGKSQEAFSTSKKSLGLTPVPRGRSWAHAFVQLSQDEPTHSSLSYIKILSKDGSHFWDITADLEEENAFEIFWNPQLQNFAVRPYHTLTRDRKMPSQMPSKAQQSERFEDQ